MKHFKRVFQLFFLFLSLTCLIDQAVAQGLNIPSKNWGISFGNSVRFTGLRMNIIDKNIEHVNGIDLSVYQPKDEELHTGTVNGISIGIPYAGSDVTGFTFGGLGFGAGGIGAPSIKGINVALFVGGVEAKGIQIAPAYFRVQGDEGGSMTGVSVSAFNHIKGSQRGLAIGIFNYALECKGVQIGVLNHIASNPSGLRWLPLINASFK